MSTTATPRTWDVELHCRTAGQPTEVVQATPSELSDTLAMSLQYATAEGAEYLRAGLATEVRLHVHKTTQARGREHDRTFLLYTDRGRVYRQRL